MGATGLIGAVLVLIYRSVLSGLVDGTKLELVFLEEKGPVSALIGLILYAFDMLSYALG